MKERSMNVLNGARSAVKARPMETRWSLIGVALGAFLGSLVGGIGIAALGGAAGIPAVILLAIVFGAVGNRYGISKDRPIR